MGTTVAFGGEMSKIHYLLYTLNLVVGCFGISIILPFIIMYGMDRFAVSEDLSILFLFTIPAFIGFILFPLLWYILSDKLQLQDIGMVHRLNRTTITICVISFAVIIYSCIQIQDIPWIMLVHFAVIGLGEELVFRGILLYRLQQVMNSWLAILISAAVFAFVFHSGQPFLDNVSYRLILGVVFGFIFLRSKNIWGVASIHFAYNFFVTYQL
ncbi:CPBP family intramembrane glutamic endopeptidase [Gracilibacillus saliphilus]|uniref:CPBP family intramembrane glutamic endopeptidase n=1 Tax=Gracilibacillus saliphilus TaxID=543890 RepID=UPI0013D421D0|nr:CPBP family intramembrane glutamic endopeptidase [Gracilibacillus saliphilus]